MFSFCASTLGSESPEVVIRTGSYLVSGLKKEALALDSSYSEGCIWLL